MIRSTKSNNHKMADVDKEVFAFDIYNQLTDEFGLVDKDGTIAYKIQNAVGKELDDIVYFLQQELLSKMRERVVFYPFNMSGMQR